MVRLADLDNLVIARDLISAGLRLPIVRILTGVGIKILRTLWKDIYGSSPKNGRLPDTILSFIDSYDSAAKLAAFVAIHKTVYGVSVPASVDDKLNYLPMTPQSLLNAWRDFQLISTTDLDINAAYYAVRDVSMQIVMLTKCRSCDARFIYDSGKKHTECCPFCKAIALGVRETVKCYAASPFAPLESPPPRHKNLLKAQMVGF